VYNQTIQGQPVVFNVNPKNLLINSTYLAQTYNSTYTVSVYPDNNIAASYSPGDICAAKTTTSVYTTAQTSVGYAGLALSLISCKIVGL
jgi:hypothetical protein